MASIASARSVDVMPPTQGGEGGSGAGDAVAPELRISRGSDFEARSSHHGTEAALVYHLASAGSGQNDPVVFDTVTDWTRLIQIASDENALLALHDRCRADTGAIPRVVLRHIAILALEREHRMRVLEKRLEDSLLVLNAAGIRPLLLKGSALAKTVYGSFIARPARDIDLLVEPTRANEARSLMLDAGWSADPRVAGDRSYLSHHHLPPLLDQLGSGLRLEVHRALLPPGHPFRFSLDEIWGGAQPISVGSSLAFVMHPVHHAVHVAIHFAWSHLLKQGAWHAFRDLGVLGETGLLQWEEFARTAERWQAGSCCYWTMRLGGDLCGLRIPEGLLARLRPNLPEFVLSRLSRHFAHALLRDGIDCPSVRLDRSLWRTALQPRLQGHGKARPWLVSSDLLFALAANERRLGVRPGHSPLNQVRRSGRYLAAMVAG